MGKKSVIFFWMIAAVLLAAGCNRLDPTPEGTGSLVLRLSSEEPETKAEPTTFNDVLVVVAYRNRSDALNGTVAAWQYKSSLTGTLEFVNIGTGDFTVYAFANINHTDWEENAVGQTAAGILDGNGKVDENRLLKTLSGLDGLPRPYAAGATDEQVKAALQQTLMSGKKEITVNKDYTPAEVVLQHPVVLLNVTVLNNTHQPIKLEMLRFDAFAMPTSYLLGRAVNGVPTVPTGTPYALHPIHADEASEQISIAADQAKWTIPMLIYENAAPAANYRMYATVSLSGTQKHLGGGADVGQALVKVKDAVSTPITFMHRNQEVNIVLNVYYQNLTVDLSVSVAPWVNGGGGSHTFN